MVNVKIANFSQVVSRVERTEVDQLNLEKTSSADHEFVLDSR